MPTKFIAEVSSNHNKDLQRCLDFVCAAAEIGCDVVKFQLFKIDELFAPEILRTSPEHQKRREWELPLSFIPKIHEACVKYDIEFACTPFYLKAVDELAPWISTYKIASYELLWADLLKACGRTGKPVILSTGMANIDEIDRAVASLREVHTKDICLLHCVSAYPTPEDECNLSVLEKYRQRYGVSVGWSDHSVSSHVLQRAIHRWNADFIEFHLDLDKKGEEFSAGHCWLPDQISPLIKSAKKAAIIDGCDRVSLSASEAADRDWRADPSDGLRPLSKLRQKFS